MAVPAPPAPEVEAFTDGVPPTAPAPPPPAAGYGLLEPGTVPDALPKPVSGLILP